MRTYTYVATSARAELVADQVDILLTYAGVGKESRSQVMTALRERWLDEVGVYLTDSMGRLTHEFVIKIGWESREEGRPQSLLATDLPGSGVDAIPKVWSMAKQFGDKAREHGQSPLHWVSFTPRSAAIGCSLSDFRGKPATRLARRRMTPLVCTPDAAVGRWMTEPR